MLTTSSPAPLAPAPLAPLNKKTAPLNNKTSPLSKKTREEFRDPNRTTTSSSTPCWIGVLTNRPVWPRVGSSFHPLLAMAVLLLLAVVMAMMQQQQQQRQQRGFSAPTTGGPSMALPVNVLIYPRLPPAVAVLVVVVVVAGLGVVVRVVVVVVRAVVVRVVVVRAGPIRPPSPRWCSRASSTSSPAAAAPPHQPPALLLALAPIRTSSKTPSKHNPHPAYPN
mmetsp:Transcript_37412/g.81510  ORF Transcript_37412/g.81510 Transcript_37412/m.81510 type:complete len:222 (+) Transcript_37412:528-1193(+)